MDSASDTKAMNGVVQQHDEFAGIEVDVSSEYLHQSPKFYLPYGRILDSNAP